MADQKGKISGIRVTFGSLNEKMAELKKNRQNKKEEVKGFSEGGVSTEVSEEEKDLAAQIAEIEKLQEEWKEQLVGALSAQEETKENQQETQKENDDIAEFLSVEDKKKQAQSFAKQLEKIGFQCNISQIGDEFNIEIEKPREKESETPGTSPKPVEFLHVEIGREGISR